MLYVLYNSTSLEARRAEGLNRYYVLVAVCIFARKAEWLKSAALGAALLFPAVAALHGIVLAAVHIPTAVDLDVYGAFQLCAVGALAAPVTVRVSRTYFHQPGRNTIFVWASIVLAGERLPWPKHLGSLTDLDVTQKVY